jgi:hypothetical protein
MTVFIKPQARSKTYLGCLVEQDHSVFIAQLCGQRILHAEAHTKCYASCEGKYFRPHRVLRQRF